MHTKFVRAAFTLLVVSASLGAIRLTEGAIRSSSFVSVAVPAVSAVICLLVLVSRSPIFPSALLALSFILIAYEDLQRQWPIDSRGLLETTASRVLGGTLAESASSDAAEAASDPLSQGNITDVMFFPPPPAFVALGAFAFGNLISIALHRLSLSSSARAASSLSYATHAARGWLTALGALTAIHAMLSLRLILFSHWFLALSSGAHRALALAAANLQPSARLTGIRIAWATLMPDIAHQFTGFLCLFGPFALAPLLFADKQARLTLLCATAALHAAAAVLYGSSVGWEMSLLLISIAFFLHGYDIHSILEETGDSAVLSRADLKETSLEDGSRASAHEDRRVREHEHYLRQLSDDALHVWLLERGVTENDANDFSASNSLGREHLLSSVIDQSVSESDKALLQRLRSAVLLKHSSVSLPLYWQRSLQTNVARSIAVAWAVGCLLAAFLVIYYSPPVSSTAEKEKVLMTSSGNEEPALAIEPYSAIDSNRPAGEHCVEIRREAMDVCWPKGAYWVTADGAKSELGETYRASVEFPLPFPHYGVAGNQRRVLQRSNFHALTSGRPVFDWYTFEDAGQRRSCRRAVLALLCAIEYPPCEPTGQLIDRKMLDEVKSSCGSMFSPLLLPPTSLQAEMFGSAGAALVLPKGSDNNDEALFFAEEHPEIHFHHKKN